MTGVVPLVHVKTELFGNTLISSPFCVYGGPLAADRESFAALDAYAADLMRSTGATATEYRFLEPPPEGWLEGEWHAKDDLYVTFRKPIGPSDDANMKAIPRKQRAMVRKGIDRGLTSRTGRTWRRCTPSTPRACATWGHPCSAASTFACSPRCSRIGWT